MPPKRSSPVSPPCLPPDTRLYAIGDVHGRYDLLEELIGRIEADERGRAPAATQLIFLGDLIDRGPDSRRVVECVQELCGEGRARLLKGNHEEVFVRAARGEGKAARSLIELGGKATLRSYGLSDEEIEGGSFHDLAARIRERVPRDHVAFLDRAEEAIAIGDYLFVHAGIRPGRALEDQSGVDLRWIRDSFLNSDADHGRIIVHGHTPANEVEVRVNRIGIDTGAYVTGTLSALGLEGEERWFVQTPGTGRLRLATASPEPPGKLAEAGKRARFLGLF